MPGLNVDAILESLGRQKTAEEKLVIGLSEKPAETEEVKAEETSVEKTSEETVKETEVKETEVKETEVKEAAEETRTDAEIKLAEAEKAYNEAKATLEAEKNAEVEKISAEEVEKIKEAEETGRIMARGFQDELNKLAAVTEVQNTETEVQNTETVEPAEELSKQAQVLVNLYTHFYGGKE